MSGLRMRPSQTMPQLHYTRQDIQEQYLAQTPSRRPLAAPAGTKLLTDGGQQRHEEPQRQRQRGRRQQQQQRARSSDPRRPVEGDDDENQEPEWGRQGSRDHDQDQDEDEEPTETENSMASQCDGELSGGLKRSARPNRRKKRRRSHSASLFAGCFHLPAHLASMLPSSAESSSRPSTGPTGRRSFLAHLAAGFSSSSSAASASAAASTRAQGNPSNRPLSASQTAGNLQQHLDRGLPAGRKHVSFGSRRASGCELDGQEQQDAGFEQPAQVKASRPPPQAAAATTARQPAAPRPVKVGQPVQGSSVIMRNYQAHQAAAAAGPSRALASAVASSSTGAAAGVAPQQPPPAAAAMEQSPIYLVSQVPGAPISAGPNQAAAARRQPPATPTPNQQPTAASIYRRLPAVPMRTQATQTEITAYHLMAAPTATPTLSNSPASSSLGGRLREGPLRSGEAPAQPTPTPSRASSSGTAPVAATQPSATPSSAAAPARQPGGRRPLQIRAGSEDVEQEDDEWSAGDDEEEEEDDEEPGTPRRPPSVAAAQSPSSSSSSASVASLVGHDQTLAEAAGLATVAVAVAKPPAPSGATRSRQRQSDKRPPETMPGASIMAPATAQDGDARPCQAGGPAVLAAAAAPPPATVATATKLKSDNEAAAPEVEPPSEFKDSTETEARLEEFESQEASSQTDPLPAGLVGRRACGSLGRPGGLEDEADEDDETISDILMAAPGHHEEPPAFQPPSRPGRFSSPAAERRDHFLTLDLAPPAFPEAPSSSSQVAAAPPLTATEVPPPRATTTDSKRSSTSTLSARHHSYCSSDDLQRGSSDFALGDLEEVAGDHHQPPPCRLRELELALAEEMDEPARPDNHNQNRALDADAQDAASAASHSPLGEAEGAGRDLLAGKDPSEAPQTAANGRPSGAQSTDLDEAAAAATIKLDCSISSATSGDSAPTSPSGGHKAAADEDDQARRPPPPTSSRLDEIELASRLSGQLLEEAAADARFLLQLERKSQQQHLHHRKRSSCTPPATLSELDEEDDEVVESRPLELADQVRLVADSVVSELMGELRVAPNTPTSSIASSISRKSSTKSMADQTDPSTTTTTSLGGAARPCCHPRHEPHQTATEASLAEPAPRPRPAPPEKPAHLRAAASSSGANQTADVAPTTTTSSSSEPSERPAAAAAIAVTATSIAAAALLHTSYRPPTRLWPGAHLAADLTTKEEEEEHAPPEASVDGSGEAAEEEAEEREEEEEEEVGASVGALVSQESRDGTTHSDGQPSAISTVVAAGQVRHSDASSSSSATSAATATTATTATSATSAATSNNNNNDDDNNGGGGNLLSAATSFELESNEAEPEVASEASGRPYAPSGSGRLVGAALSTERDLSQSEFTLASLELAAAAATSASSISAPQAGGGTTTSATSAASATTTKLARLEQRRRSAGATLTYSSSSMGAPTTTTATTTASGSRQATPSPPHYVRGDLAPPPCSPPLVAQPAQVGAHQHQSASSSSSMGGHAMRHLSHDDTMEAIEEADDASDEDDGCDGPAYTPPAGDERQQSPPADDKLGLREEEDEDDDEESSISVSQRGVLVERLAPAALTASSSSSSSSPSAASSRSNTPTGGVKEGGKSEAAAKESSPEVAAASVEAEDRDEKEGERAKEQPAKTPSTESATDAILEHLSRHHQRQTELPLSEEPAPPLEPPRSVASALARRESWRLKSPQAASESAANQTLEPAKEAPQVNQELETAGGGDELEQASGAASWQDNNNEDDNSEQGDATGTIKRRKRRPEEKQVQATQQQQQPQRRGPPLAQLKSAGATTQAGNQQGSSLADTSICSSCSCMEPPPLVAQEQSTPTPRPEDQEKPESSTSGSGSGKQTVPSGQWMSQEEGTVFTENYWLSHWLYISEQEESEIWRRAIDMNSQQATSNQEEETPAAAGMPEQMSEISETSSERAFCAKYKSTTRKMVHRRATIEMYKRLMANNLKREKRVEISRSNGEFGFRIHGSRPVVVSAIERGTSAETCGLQVGDLIYAINGTNILDMAHSEVVKLAHSAHSSSLILDLVPTNQFLKSPRYQSTATTTAARRHEATVAGHLMRLSPSTAQPLLVELQEQVASSKQALSSQQRSQRLQEVMRLAWRQRYFVLRNDNCLYWYRRAQDIEPLGGVNLQGFSASLTNEFSEPTYVIRLVKYGSQPHYLGTNNVCDIQTWIDAINKAATEANQNDPYMRRTLTLARTRPSQIPEPDCAGYLYKFSHKRSGGAHWRAAYFVLKDACLYLFRDQQADTVSQASAVYYLHGYRVRNKHIEQKKFTFELIPPNRKTIRPMFLMANSELDRKRWIAALEYSIDRWLEID